MYTHRTADIISTFTFIQSHSKVQSTTSNFTILFERCLLFAKYINYSTHDIKPRKRLASSSQRAALFQSPICSHQQTVATTGNTTRLPSAAH